MNLKAILSLCVLTSCCHSTLFAQDTRFAWAKSMGGKNDESTTSVAADATGCIYTVGYFKDTADFDPGPAVYNMVSDGLNDIFISKLDRDGNFVWAKKIGNAAEQWAHNIVIDAGGTVYMSGEFQGTIDLDPGPGVSNFTGTGLHAFVLKLDTAGNLIWAKQFGGTASYNYATSITSDPSGNVYASGYFWNGTTDFDPGVNVLNFSSAGNFEAFMFKLDADGNLAWARQIGSSGHDWARKIVVDAAGDVYTTGEFQGIIDFDPGAGTANLVAAGSSDIFVTKVNTKGMFHWAKRIGGSGWDEPADITLDPWDNIYITGRFAETVDFDPGAGVYNLTGNSIDAFVLKLNNSGEFLWARRTGGKYADFGSSVKTDAKGDVYTSGGFVERVDFDPGPDSSFLDAGYFNRNGFVSKLDTGGNFIWAKSLGGMSYNYDAIMTLDFLGNIVVTGFFSDTGDYDPETPVFDLLAAGGVDVYVLKLAPCSSTGSFSVSACETYVSPSGKYTWTSGGIYHDTIPNVSGCDSVITVNLTIHYNAASMMVAKACREFVSPSLKYTWTQSGDYTDTIPASNGCDSIILVNLEILMGELAITYNSSTLSASVDSAAYQWIDCNNGYAPVAGQTGQHFKPAVNGSYAVVLTKNGCRDTSDCVNMDAVGLYENMFGSNVDVYPNPTSGQVNVILGTTQDVQVTVKNMLGQEVVSQTFKQKDKLQILIPGDPGIYFMELTRAENHKVCVKVVRQ